ncbi:MAG TPA: hypothetical protein VEU54_00300 [Steroidobacteraceae bacterium]|jgi:hypothetical protein|nr:hypothetical protein [Steroidobacteraceae bacterium]
MTGARILIGIDDTDDLESRGTGFHARELGRLIEQAGLGTCSGVSRHQLLFDRRIPYTSHNSSLCLDLTADPASGAALHMHCRAYLLASSARDADVGLCIVAWQDVDHAVEEFGRRAKREILTQDEATGLSRDRNILLEGLTGDRGGVIGALAAAGLRRTDRDGRFVWRRGVRELSGVVTAGELLASTGIDEIRSLSGTAVGSGDAINVEPWPRPVLIDGRAVLLVEEVEETDAPYRWRNAPKSVVKQY